MLAKLYLLFPPKKCLTDLMYKVTVMSAPAPCFTSSSNGLPHKKHCLLSDYVKKGFVICCL